MSSDSPVKWFDNLVGVAYRYYDLRMNVVPLFGDFKVAQEFWRETIKWWNDHSIKIRFVETGDTYWFIMGAESTSRENDRFLFKILPISSHYERFKKGHEGTAYLRLGVYTKKYKKDVKNGQQSEKIILGGNAITFSSEGVLTHMRALINSTRLDLQNKTDFRQKFLSKKLRSIEHTKQNDHFPYWILFILI